ncbi:DUF3750 domain-containing protein [Arhodomonas sp. SL1]|uniref:DUF3750 domain-containing protein n=1 Tax=Arhodomonas sp. SL1 TaxID=3425691 RepID=UPI003F882658
MSSPPKRWLRRLLLLLAVLLVGPAIVVIGGEVSLGGQWYEADRSPTGLAPEPADHPAAVVQVYAARAFDWRGIFAVHTWIATKEKGASSYTVHQVLGWHHRRGRSAVSSGPGAPDRTWFNSPPQLLADHRGTAAETLVAEVHSAVERYPHADEYRLWPGPNSNTFTAWVAREVPALQITLPPTAIGKDYLGTRLVAPTPSGTGWQVSLGGLLGVTLARSEGVEINLLGLAFGFRPWPPGITLPGIGRWGFGELPPRPALAERRP